MKLSCLTILQDYCQRGKVEHLIRMRERLDDHSRFLESQLAGLEALVKEKGEIDVVVPALDHDEGLAPLRGSPVIARPSPPPIPPPKLSAQPPPMTLASSTKDKTGDFKNLTGSRDPGPGEPAVPGHDVEPDGTAKQKAADIARLKKGAEVGQEPNP